MNINSIADIFKIVFFSLTRAIKQLMHQPCRWEHCITPVASVSAMEAETGIIYLAVSHIQNPCIDYL